MQKVGHVVIHIFHLPDREYSNIDPIKPLLISRLRRSRPDLRVAIMVEDRFRALFEDNPDMDEILPPRSRALRRFRPRLCLNLHGGTRSAWMTALSGARYRAGFGHFRQQLVYNVHIPRAQEILGVERKVHTAEHLASAMFLLGAPMGEIPRAKLVARRVRAAPSQPIAVIHPVAATPEKTWRADGFLAVAGHLARTRAGAGLHRRRRRRSFALPRLPHRAGAPLGEVKSLLAGASLFVGNDSGPAHMAAAFGLPVVVIFGDSDPAIWGPWRTASEVVAAPGGIGAVATVAGAGRAGAPAGAGMKQLSAPALVRPPLLAASSGFGGADGRGGRRAGRHAAAGPPGLRPRAGGPIRPPARTPLLPHPILRPPDLIWNSIIPFARQRVWAMVAIAIVAVFLIKGLCDYLRQLPDQLRGLFVGHRPAQRGLRQGAASRARSSSKRTPPGQLMSSIMNDVDKVQVATSQILADFLRQFFAAGRLIFVLVSLDPKLRVVSLIVLPAVMLPTTRDRPAHPPHQPPHAGAAGRAQPDPAGNPQRPHGGARPSAPRLTNPAASARPPAGC